MDNHYLMIFNEDWADEHDVPALACFTQEEYDKWLETKFGELNPNYEEQRKNYVAYLDAKVVLQSEIKEKLGDNWSRVPFTDWPENLVDRYDELPSKFGYNNSWPDQPTKLSSSFIYAYLGNSGDNFSDKFLNCPTGKDLLEKFVKVVEVSEEFYNSFHENDLDSLSLCNIFDYNDE